MILRVFKGSENIFENEVSENQIVGREKSSDVVIEHRSVSKKWFVIKNEEIDFFKSIQDLKKDEQDLKKIYSYLDFRIELEKISTDEEKSQGVISEAIGDLGNLNEDFGADKSDSQNSGFENDFELFDASNEDLNSEGISGFPEQVTEDEQTKVLSTSIESELIEETDTGERRFEVKQIMTIGSSETSDLIIEGLGFDVKIEKTNDDFFLTSSEPVKVNQASGTEFHLSGGDLIQIQNRIFVFSLKSNFIEENEDSNFLSESLIQNEPSIQENNVEPNKKETLIEKFKRQPRPRQILIVFGLLGLGLFLLDEPSTQKTDKIPEIQENANLKNGLTPEQIGFLDAQYDTALNYYNSQNYERTLLELQKIFEVTENYKNARDLQKYAEESIRKINQDKEASLREQKRKEKEERILSIVLKTKSLMDKRNYENARKLFSEILILDPDNENVKEWQEEIRNFEVQTRLKMEKLENEKRAKETIESALSLARVRSVEKNYIKALDLLNEVKFSPYKEFFKEKDLQSIQIEIEKINSIWNQETKVLIEEAKKLKGAQDYKNAYLKFKMALDFKKDSKEVAEEFYDLEQKLLKRGKQLYTEAIFAESISDFDLAIEKYNEVIGSMPKEILYYEKAKVKLNKLSLIIEEE